MSPSNFNYDLYKFCLNKDVKTLIYIASSLHLTYIDDLYIILQDLYNNHIINYNITMDDIKNEILLSRYIIYYEQCRIITNSLIDDTSVLFSTDSYILRLKELI